MLGLGEAGGEIARDLIAAGASVQAYDPVVSAPPGSSPSANEAEAAAGADIVISVNSGHDARRALRSAVPALRAGMVWAELNTSSSRAKQELAEMVEPLGVHFADVALMATVPGRGLRTPSLASGPGAPYYADLLVPLGAQVEILDGPVGDAATRKLLRSVFFKGTSAAVIEALAAARAAGLEHWMFDHIATTLADADRSLVQRMVDGSYQHAHRRADEMIAAAELLRDLDVAPRVSEAATRWLIELEASGT